MAKIRPWVKERQHPMARLCFDAYWQLRQFELPRWRVLFVFLYYVHQSVHGLLSNLVRIFYWTPLFKSQIQRGGKGLYLYGGMPLLMGPLHIQVGERCRISGVTTFCGRVTHPQTPQLLVGSNVDIGWQTTIAVAGRVVLEDDVRMAGRVFLAGFPGHPLDPSARASGAPETDQQVGDIVLKRGVWLATGVMVNAGVTIGEGTVVAAGSVVTHDLPAGVLAAGVPARVVRYLGD